MHHKEKEGIKRRGRGRFWRARVEVIGSLEIKQKRERLGGGPSPIVSQSLSFENCNSTKTYSSHPVYSFLHRSYNLLNTIRVLESHHKRSFYPLQNQLSQRDLANCFTRKKPMVQINNCQKRYQDSVFWDDIRRFQPPSHPNFNYIHLFPL